MNLKILARISLSPDWATGVMFGTMFFISLIMFFLLEG